MSQVCFVAVGLFSTCFIWVWIQMDLIQRNHVDKKCCRFLAILSELFAMRFASPLPAVFYVTPSMGLYAAGNRASTTSLPKTADKDFKLYSLTRPCLGGVFSSLEKAKPRHF